MKKTRTRIGSILLSLALILTLLPVTALAEELTEVEYLDENGKTATCDSATVVDDTTLTWSDETDSLGWYVVNTNVTISTRIKVSGDVHLILTDGHTLTANQGISVTSDNSLTIYGQRGNTGELDAELIGTGYGDIGYAGIGGNLGTVDKSAAVHGDITINGGTIKVSGGTNAAGIGGGWSLSVEGENGTITINGGTVEATGGDNAAGIGGGYLNCMTGGDITINGGTVEAIGGDNAAGIGGGMSNGPESGRTILITKTAGVTAQGGANAAGIGSGYKNEARSIGRITINGRAMVDATGGAGGAGIGGSYEGKITGPIQIAGSSYVTAKGGGANVGTHYVSFGGAGIGGGGNGKAGNIVISGGTVTATGGTGDTFNAGETSEISYHGSGIGSGAMGYGDTMSVTISGGTVTATSGGTGADGIGSGTNGTSGTFSTQKDGSDPGSAVIHASSISDDENTDDWSGIIFQGMAGKVYGDVTLEEDLEIESSETLEVPEGARLTVAEDATLTNNGAITNEGEILVYGELEGKVTEGSNKPVTNPVASYTDSTGKTVLAETLQDAVTKAANNTTVELLRNADLTEAVEIEARGLTIDGKNHILTANSYVAADSIIGGMIVSKGGNTIKNLTVDLSKATNAKEDQPIILVHGGDVVQKVTVIAAGNKIMYGISVDGTTADNESVTIEGCTLKNCERGISAEASGVATPPPPSRVETLIIDGCTFENCNRASLSYVTNTTFRNNTVKGAKLNILYSTQTVTGNKFEDKSRVSFYCNDSTFTGNTLTGGSYLEFTRMGNYSEIQHNRDLSGNDFEDTIIIELDQGKDTKVSSAQITLPTPAKEDSIFQGWDNGTETYPGGKTVTVTDAKATFTARWTSVVDVASVSLDRSELTLAMGGTATLTATVEPSNATNPAVTWKSDNEKVATVDDNGHVTAVGVGETTITATSAADPTKFATCAVIVTYADVTSVSLDKETLDLTKGETAALTATVEPATADQTVIWKSDNEDVATVDNSGKVTAVGVGKAIITATSGGMTAECKVTVSYAEVTGITLDQTEVTLAAGGTTELKATVSPSNADQNVTWTSSDGKVASVNNGKVTGINEGEATITATAAGGKAVECKVTVTAEGEVIVNVAEPDVKVEISGVELSGNQKGAIENTAKSVNADAAIAVAAKAVSDDLNIEDLMAQAREALKVGDTTPIYLFTQAYLEIVATGAEISEDGKLTSITLDIKPMVRVLASTAASIKDLDNTNFVEVREPQELTISGNANIQLTLPDDLTGVSALYIKHEKDAEHTYYYQGTVSDRTLSFLNPHGFSEFTFPADGEVVAAIDDQGYTTLETAVNAASNRDTITLNQNSAETVTVQRSITFTLDKNGNDFTGTISAGAGYEMNTATNEGKITYTFTRISTGGSGSSGASGDYIISVDKTTGGKVTVNPGRADKGDEVTITAVPNDGYELSSLTVTDKSGDTVRVSSEGNDKYTFTMPSGAVTVKAVFAPEGSVVVTPVTSFTDVAESFWAYNEIQWAAENGYMNGTSATTFNPTGTVTRQQVWMILARMAGANPADMSAAKTWAVNNGISDGTNPGGAVTRQQLVSLLYRFAGQNGYDTSAKADLSGYPDVASLASYATDAMAWAVANGIVGGTTQGTLNPAGTANRAQFAVILWRFYQTSAA